MWPTREDGRGVHIKSLRTYVHWKIVYTSTSKVGSFFFSLRHFHYAQACVFLFAIVRVARAVARNHIGAP